jgi:hypothetical protein
MEENKTRGIRRFGPIEVIAIDAESSLKLYSFCKRSFHHLSKGVLTKCFNNASIFVNNEKIRPGHEDESRKLVEGDVVEIHIDLDIEDALIVEKTDLQVLHIQDGYAVLYKPSGLSSAFGKEMDKALKSKLWNGSRKHTCQLLYNLEKGFSGLCIVAEDSYDLLKLRGLLCVNPNLKGGYPGTDGVDGVSIKGDPGNDGDDGISIERNDSQHHSTTHVRPFIELIHRCIISGKVGEIGDTVFIETGHKDYPYIEARVLEISKSRAVDFISLIDIRITFDKDDMGVTKVDMGVTKDDMGVYTDQIDDNHKDIDDHISKENDKNDENDENDENNNNHSFDKINDEDEIENGNYDEKVVDNQNNNDTENKNDSNNDTHISDTNDEDEDENGNYGKNYEKNSPSYNTKSTVLTIDRIKSPKNKDDFRFLRYTTVRIKTIKRALSLCGHTIVG